MKLLLDTHALILSIVAPEQLSEAAVKALTDPAQQQGFDLLPLDARLAASFSQWPLASLRPVVA